MAGLEAVRIPLYGSGGKVVGYSLVDGVDAGLAAYRWHMNHNGYAVHSVNQRGNRHTLRMHREILGMARGDKREVDHRNLDKLDNRRSNLRVATRAQNAQNQPAQPGRTSRYRGVHWHVRREKWRAQATLDGRQHFLGSFDSEDAAAAAVAAFRREHMPFAAEAMA